MLVQQAYANFARDVTVKVAQRYKRALTNAALRRSLVQIQSSWLLFERDWDGDAPRNMAAGVHGEFYKMKREGPTNPTRTLFRKQLI